MPESTFYLFEKEVESWYSTNWFIIWHFRTLVQKRYLQMHLLTELFRFFWGGGGVCRLGFFSHRVENHQMAPMSPLNSPTCCLFLTCILYEQHSYKNLRVVDAASWKGVWLIHFIFLLERYEILMQQETLFMLNSMPLWLCMLTAACRLGLKWSSMKRQLFSRFHVKYMKASFAFETSSEYA
jgi:hypothetical protein